VKTILFFDDWMLEQRIGLDRIIGEPACLGEFFPQRPASVKHWMPRGFFFDSRVGRYVMYLNVVPKKGGEGVKTRFSLRLELDRPDQWEAPVLDDTVSEPWKGCPNLVVNQDTGDPICGDVTPLAGTPHASRGYVMTYGNPHTDVRAHFLAFSEDGVHFRVDRDHPWLNDYSDTWNGVVYDSRSQTYRIYCRPGCGDRRESVVITSDFESFSEPTVIWQPDGNDPVLTEIYGLPTFAYEDMYVGFPQIYTPSPFEPRRIKMEGRVVPELGYSYNGLNWYRTNRRPFVPLRPLGEMGGGGLYLGDLISTSEGRILMIAGGTVCDHGGVITLERSGRDISGYSGALLYELRQDGFCYFKTSGREGRLRTRTIIPRSGDLSLNVRTASHSMVRVQILESGHREIVLEGGIDSIVPQTPVPGYTFDDCIPIVGDHLSAAARWKDHADLSEFIDRPIRIEIQAIEAELYAIRLDCLGNWSHAETEYLG
jgi:hypothetical protein